MKTGKDIKILVAAHKKCWIPEEEMYMPIHVGKSISSEELNFAGDNTGDNISCKNPSYCELTAVYWAWKNLNHQYVGFVQYGRYFARKSINSLLAKDNRSCILTQADLEKKLQNSEVILPKKRRYYIENIYNHYAHTHDCNHLKETRAIILELFPDYLEAYDLVMNRTYAHMFNIFVMKQDILREYCTWLFAILTELEIRIDSSQMTSFEKRYIGRISELLLDVWLEKKQIPYREVGWIYLRKINFVKKVKSFLLAKYTNKKYEGSF